ncbi:polysaccharide deacetylase family protein [Halorientalis marina]|uniref:polysaccharide deacetylase family protein n=1 Tax=Halorientalis marina TaxID=2931976 RepID=UPI001FF4E3BD|nr:polysaccharide deacetylase family protein [Halorientalis marina]
MASVVVSVDAELSNHRPPTERAKRRARYGWRRLLSLFETYDVPATWAVVGRLCTTEDTIAPPAAEEWFTDGATESFDRDAAAVVGERRALARDLTAPWLVDALAENPVEHDIGSHSYSHPRFTNVSRELAVADVEAATAALEGWNPDPDSFVYPFNAVAHRDVLAEAGFTCYRGTAGPDAGQESSVDRHPFHPLELVPERPKELAGWAFDRLSEAVTWTVGSSGPGLVEPELDDSGLVAVPSSLPSLYRMPVAVRSALRDAGRYPLARVATRGVDRAVERDRTIHLWFHPADFHTERDFRSLERVLEHVHRRRANGLQVETMADVAVRVRS